MNDVPLVNDVPLLWRCDGCGGMFAMDVTHACPGPKLSRTGMLTTRWLYLKSLQPRDTQMFVSCAPDKDKHSRATYRKAEHGERD